MTTTATKTPANKPAAARKPTATKRPQDHQPKTVSPKVEKADGGKNVTLRGISVFVADDALNDFELLDDLAQIQTAEGSARMPGMLRRLVGEDGYLAVMTGLRNKDTGRVPVDLAAEFIAEIFAAIAPN